MKNKDQQINAKIRRIGKLNGLIAFTTDTWEKVWQLDNKDETCEFMDELVAIKKAIEDLEEAVMIQAKQIKV